MRSSGQRLAVTLPSGAEFDTQPSRIDGKPTPLQTGAKNQFFVPLKGLGGDRPFLLELRYTLSNVWARVDLPAFRDEPAVQKVYVTVFLPEEKALLGFHGPWTDEQEAYDHSIFRQTYATHEADNRLVAWVREGVVVAENPGDTFPVDGRPYVFSTLRPEAGNVGSLRLTAINGNFLEFLVFVFVISIGLALRRRPMAARGSAIALLVIALVLLGVFLPTFATQIFNGGMWLAILLTAIVWQSWYLFERSKRPRPVAVATGAGGTSQSNPFGRENVAPPSDSGLPLNSGPPVSRPPDENPPGENPPSADASNPGGGTHG